MHKEWIFDEMVNNIRLTWKLVCMLRINRTCNLTVRFIKYEFNNNLLGGVILLRVTLNVTWTQLLYIYSLAPENFLYHNYQKVNWEYT